MTELLQKAFAEAANLPDAEQDELAKALLEDLAAGREVGSSVCELARPVGGPWG